jgi:hypothetical protein
MIWCSRSHTPARYISDRPSLSPEAAAKAIEMYRAARAQVSLLEKAIAWGQKPVEQRDNPRELAVFRLLGVPPDLKPPG